MSSDTYDIPRHASAGVAFLGVELADTVILIVSVFLGLLAGSFLHWGGLGYVGVPTVGYFANKTFLDWRGNSLPGQFRAYLFSIGLLAYSRAFKSRNVVYVGDATVINPGSREIVERAMSHLSRVR